MYQMAGNGEERLLNENGKGRYFSVNGLNMYYEIHGSGRPLLLLNGGMSTIQSSFGVILPALAATRQVIAVEQQGHGRTADIDRPLTFEQMVSDTAAFIRHLNIEPTDIFGYSNGGTVALGIAIRHPELVRALVVAGSTFNNDGLYPEILESMQNATIADAANMRPELRDAYTSVAPRPEDLPTLFSKVTQLNVTFEGWSPDAIQSIDAPTLVIIGDADIVRPDHAVELFRLLPHAQLAILPDTDHFIRLDRPAMLLSILEEFFEPPMPDSG